MCSQKKTHLNFPWWVCFPIEQLLFWFPFRFGWFLVDPWHTLRPWWSWIPLERSSTHCPTSWKSDPPKKATVLTSKIEVSSAYSVTLTWTQTSGELRLIDPEVLAVRWLVDSSTKCLVLAGSVCSNVGISVFFIRFWTSLAQIKEAEDWGSWCHEKCFSMRSWYQFGWRKW